MMAARSHPWQRFPRQQSIHFEARSRVQWSESLSLNQFSKPAYEGHICARTFPKCCKTKAPKKRRLRIRKSNAAKGSGDHLQFCPRTSAPSSIVSLNAELRISLQYLRTISTRPLDVTNF
jgi:hypothetical protein